MCFARKHNKKSLKKVQDNSTKAVRACAEAVKALVKPKEIRPSILNGGRCKLSQLGYIVHPKRRKHVGAVLPRVSNFGLNQPKAKALTKAQAMPVAQAPKSAPNPP
ncbi:60S ribosomal protein L29-like [Neovison vison]|uniref:60S ribosomal protein L29-like n=1 Tax=Neovison vison TaxID=452646 RepID=UPI001CF03166|nr:60S ribosomal protein L29-like [Neogale vison]